MNSRARHLVIDGSNIATEGRNLPSLQQLDEAVRGVIAERSFESVTVIVDATFAHRIDDSEKNEFEQAVDAGEIIMPPAGVVGRGDAFILQVADKAEAAVLSNDSFQEFHGEHTWLFDEGRLIGGKPIEHVGWVFVDRVPVRGPASRRAVREARGGGSGGGRKRSSRSTKSQSRSSSKSRSKSEVATGPMPVPKTPPPSSGSKGNDAETTTAKGRGRGRGRKSADKSSRKKTDARPTASDNELNEPRTFLSFVTANSIGDSVEGVVELFASHGCYVRAGGAQCYLPSKAMGDPPPTKARDVVSHNQTVTVRVVSLDSDRRGINVELIDVGEIQEDPESQPHQVASTAESDAGEANPQTRSTHDVATKKKAAKKAAPKKKATKKAAPKKAAKKVTKKATKKAAPKKAAKKRTTKKAAPKKAAKKKATRR